MRKTTLFAVAAVLIATGFGVWAASPAHVAPSMGQGIQPFQLMVSAKDMPRGQSSCYSFVFAH
jgi:hypothetical protein